MLAQLCCEYKHIALRSRLFLRVIITTSTSDCTTAGSLGSTATSGEA